MKIISNIKKFLHVNYYLNHFSVLTDLSQQPLRLLGNSTEKLSNLLSSPRRERKAVEDNPGLESSTCRISAYLHARSYMGVKGFTLKIKPLDSP